MEEKGVKGLYKGVKPRVLRIAIHNGCFLFIYETLKKEFRDSNEL